MSIKKNQKEIIRLNKESERLSKNLDKINQHNNVPEKVRQIYKQEEELAILKTKKTALEERLQVVEIENKTQKT